MRATELGAATDLAILATTTALLHYALGVYGLSACLLLLAVAEHGQAAWAELCELVWTADTVGRRRTLVPVAGKGRLSPPPPPSERRGSSAWTDVDSSSDHDAEEEEGEEEDASRRTLFQKLTLHDLSSHPRSPPSSSSSSATTASTASTASAAGTEVELNSSRAVAFENDLFVGRVLFLVRTTPEDPRWTHLFLGKRRRFWIQVQGRFKRAPRGVVYLGGELPSPVSLSFFTKSIALVIFGIIQQLVGNVYVNFGGGGGGGGDSDDHQLLPSISFPLYQSVDQFTVTPPGDAPPPLGVEDFGESDAARHQRRRTPVEQPVFSVGPTYSFHFHTMYVDLLRWQTANLPGLSDMPLANFFDAQPLRLVAYDVAASPRAPHRQQDKQYLFNFQVSHRTEEDEPPPARLWRSDSEQSIASSEATSTATSTSPSPSFTLATVEQEHARRLRGISTLEYLYWIEEVDVSTALRRVQYVYRIREHSEEEVDDDDERLVVVSAYKLRLLVDSKLFRALPQLHALQRLRFHARSRVGSYSVIADEALEVAACLARIVHHSQSSDSADSVAFEAALYRIFTARPHLQPADEPTPSSVGVQMSKRDRDALGVAFEGVVVRFLADAVARQEVLIATRHALHFYRSFASSPEKVAPLDHVMGVQAVAPPHDSNSTHSFAFALLILTPAEEIVVCVATEHARNAWIRVILQHCNLDRQPLAVAVSAVPPLQPAGRVVLNSRSLFPRATEAQDPLLLVATALRSALAVHQQGEAADTLAFLDHAAALRTIDWSLVTSQPHEDRLAFFLNLYHVVLAHAMLAAGHPRRRGDWASFQTRMCYAVGRDPLHPSQSLTLSLAEIEHVVLRARLPRATDLPHLPEVKLPPAGRLGFLALAHPDFRVSFALLMNRPSSDETVPVMESATVHDQLNALVQQTIAALVEVDAARHTITLPRLCEWFRHDFGGGGSPLYCVRKLLGFMADELQEQAIAVLDSPRLVHIKYGGFTYTARSHLVGST